jgi:hypothetical protein
MDMERNTRRYRGIMKYIINILFLLVFCGNAFGFGNGAIVREDLEFTVAESPVVYDVANLLSTEYDSGESVFASSLSVVNTGKYDMTLEVSFNGVDYIDPQTIDSYGGDGGLANGARLIRITLPENSPPSAYAIKAFSRFAGDWSYTPGKVNAYIQDNDTEPIDTLFAESLGSFTLSADTVASGLTAGSLVYTFEATAGHGLVATDQIALNTTDRSLIAYVTNVAVNTITIDMPIDFVYPSASTFGLIINTNLAVDGSVTPRVFKIQAGITPIFIRRVIFTITDGTVMDDAKFGGITALNNGVVLRVVDGFQKSILNIKANQDFAQWGYDLNYSDKAPAGVYGVRSRFTFGGLEKHGMVFVLSGTGELQVIVQDDLTDLVTFSVSAQGNKK